MQKDYNECLRGQPLHSMEITVAQVLENKRMRDKVMIQDIAPHRYNNRFPTFRNLEHRTTSSVHPRKAISLRETAEEHVLTIPRRKEIEQHRN